MAQEKDFIIYDANSKLENLQNFLEDSSVDDENKPKVEKLNSTLTELLKAIEVYNNKLVIRNEAKEDDNTPKTTMKDVEKALTHNIETDQEIHAEIVSNEDLDEVSLGKKAIKAEKSSLKVKKLLEEFTAGKKQSEEQKNLNRASKEARRLMNLCIELWSDLELDKNSNNKDLKEALDTIELLKVNIQSITKERDQLSTELQKEQVEKTKLNSQIDDLGVYIHNNNKSIETPTDENSDGEVVLGDEEDTTTEAPHLLEWLHIYADSESFTLIQNENTRHFSMENRDKKITFSAEEETNRNENFKLLDIKTASNEEKEMFVGMVIKRASDTGKSINLDAIYDKKLFDMFKEQINPRPGLSSSRSPDNALINQL